MVSLIGPQGIALQNAAWLFNVSFLAPTTFVPILIFYDFGGDMFDLETASIPFSYSYVKPLNPAKTPNVLHTEAGFTGSRLRSLVYAFSSICLHEADLYGRRSEKICFEGAYKYKQLVAAAEMIEGTKVNFGPQFNIFFYRDFVTSEEFDFEYRGSDFLFWPLLEYTDEYLYIVNVSMSHRDNAAGSKVQLVCNACAENHQRWTTKLHKGENFPVHDVQSFWTALHDAAFETTVLGTKLHWSYDFQDSYKGTAEIYSCEAYKEFLTQDRISSFAKVYNQFVFSLFHVENASVVAQGCGISDMLEGRFGWRFRSRGDLDNGGLKLVVWNLPESFDEAFMIIIDQNVTSKRYASDLYLKAFDVESWIAVLVAGGVTCCALAMLVKTSKMKLLSGFWASIRYLGAYFLDQSKRLPFPDAVVRSKKALLFVVVPWMMAMLILSNGFRGVMKSNYVLKFPYETAFWTVEDLKSMSLFTFAQNQEYNSSEFLIVGEAWIWWTINGRSSEYWCGKKDQRPQDASWVTIRENAPDVHFKESRIDEWIVQKYPRPHRAEINNASSYSWIMNQLNKGIAVVHVSNFSQFSGSSYHTSVNKWMEIASKGPAQWNISFISTSESTNPVDSSCSENYSFTHGFTDRENYIKAFWLTRRHESAYVIRKSEFPWYWNLFKKAMVKDSQVQYAHTGGTEVALKTKRAIYERNDSPFYVFVRHRYMEPANWMIKRIAAIQESGILNLWYKWDMILRPPVNESLNEEVSEEFDEVRELRLSDPGIAFLVSVAIGLALVAIAVFAVEVTLVLV